MDEQGFLEVETPILFKSTPEGAREFLVPNRREPGTFYALPQSPQQFKQILMVGGVERYYQLARCFRDEDQRADRQLEFTQIDIEMSFIEREDIYALIEGLLKRVWKVALNQEVATPFRRLTFHDAINRYGIDKPDTRFGMELQDFTEEFRASSFKVFSGAVANGGVVKALNAKGMAGATQGQMDAMTEQARSFGAKGLAYIKVEGGEWKSPIVKFFSETEKAALNQKLSIEEGDLILFAADRWLTACEILGRIRLYCADTLRGLGKLLVPADRFDFLWVVDFPLMSFDKEQNRWYSSHHPFTAPVADDISFLNPIRKKSAASTTTSSSTAWNSAAARSVSISPTCRKPSSRNCSPYRRMKPGCDSATCWTRSNTARRRTAVSRWGSTGFARFSAARRASAT
jgi:aspartyl-tRNA synthetase